MARLAGSLDFAKTVAATMYELELKHPAATLAYYTFLSFVPLLLLVIAVLGRQLAFEVYAGSARFVTPDTQQLIYEALTAASGRTGAVLLSLVAIVWGGANVAIGFLTVVERVEEMTERPLRLQVRDAVVVLGSLSVAMLTIFSLSLLLAVPSVGPLGTIGGFALLPVVLTLTFLPLYYVPSQVVTSPSAALPGALTAACGWTVLHAGVQFYTANAAQYAIYGVVSGIIIILTTTYLAAAVLMAGVVVNALLVSETPADDAGPAEGGDRTAVADRR